MIGAPLDRVDAAAKVTGAAKYSADTALPRLAYGVIVTSTVATGRIDALDTARAERSPGVVRVFTYRNAPRVNADAAKGDRKLRLLQDDRVLYDREPVALVVADTFERATDAAALVAVRYAAEAPAFTLDAPGAQAYAPSDVHGEPANATHGDPDAAFASAAVKVDATYTTPDEFHNPMEPHATVATWENGKLTLYDASQGVFARRRSVAAILGLPVSDVRVVSKFVGGGFGSKGGTNAHTLLAAMAARELGRPVKVVLARPQMFGGNGFRPRTVQAVRLGAKRDGTLVAVTHDVHSATSRFDEFVEPSALLTRTLYAVPNIRTSHTLVRVDAPTPTYMRAPGESSGSFALESAMDELAYAANVDPLELRLRNYAETDPDTGKPFSSKSLRACYEQGAEQFGWSKRTPQPRSMRDGTLLVGYGMATATYPTHRSAASATATLHADGSALVRSGGCDIGTGAYTAFTQLSAEALGLPVERVRFDLGDTDMPAAPVAGGSQLTASVGSAIVAAGQAFRQKLGALAVALPNGPFAGRTIDDLSFANGHVALASDASRSLTYEAVLSGSGKESLDATAESEPEQADRTKYATHAFGAQFAEVRVDPDFGTVRVVRAAGAFAAGRIVNAKTARSQFLGGIVWGIGMALHEEGRADARFGRYMNANLADYLVPVNADVPAVDVVIVDEVDTNVNPAGVKGIGEIGIVGAAAAVANAVYHATGIRVRDLPIAPEKLLRA